MLPASPKKTRRRSNHSRNATASRSTPPNSRSQSGSSSDAVNLTRERERGLGRREGGRWVERKTGALSSNGGRGHFGNLQWRWRCPFSVLRHGMNSDDVGKSGRFVSYRWLIRSASWVAFNWKVEDTGSERVGIKPRDWYEEMFYWLSLIYYS